MTKRSITIELDEETLRRLRLLGDPGEQLASLAKAACESKWLAEGLRHRTDESLRVERANSKAADAEERALVQRVADEVVQTARRRADAVLLEARALTEPGADPTSMASRATAVERWGVADRLVASERATADALLGREDVSRRHTPDQHLEAARSRTNEHLSGERSHSDLLITDQREANENMVHAALHAQDLTLLAEEAKARAERHEDELLKIAELRETFIGILGHDLRNPLSAIILSATSVVDRRNGDPLDRDAAERILRSGHRIKRMIIQLLDLTRARLGGGMPIEVKPADLRPICEHVVEEFQAPIRLDSDGDLTGS